MAIRVELVHQTHYRYDQPVLLSPQLIRLKPASYNPAAIETYQLTLEPATHVVHWQQDPFGNVIARVDFTNAIVSMTIQVHLIVRLEPVNPFDFLLDLYADSFPFVYPELPKKALMPYLAIPEQGIHLAQWIRQLKHQPKGDTVTFLTGLTQQLTKTIAYQLRLTAGVQPAEVTLRRASGSCRDLAWLLVQLLRGVGLAARFVSGYLVQLAGRTSPEDDASRPVVDSVGLHAWAEVYLPGVGWLGLDPTSGLLVTEGHIPLAATPDPADAAPVTGTTGLAKAELTSTSSLTRLK